MRRDVTRQDKTKAEKRLPKLEAKPEAQMQAKSTMKRACWSLLGGPEWVVDILCCLIRFFVGHEYVHNMVSEKAVGEFAVKFVKLCWNHAPPMSAIGSVTCRRQ